MNLTEKNKNILLNNKFTFSYADKIYNEEAGIHLLIEIWGHINDLKKLNREPVYYKLTLYMESGYSVFINNNDMEVFFNRIDWWKKFLFLKPYYSIPKVKKSLCDYIVENYRSYPEIQKKVTFYRDV